MNNILLSLSLGLNLIFCAMTVTILQKVPFNIDKIRQDYLKDVRMYYNRGCMNGAQDYVRNAEPVVGYNTNSPMNWCAEQTNQMDQAFMGGLFTLGK
jgi:hypothetical protein